MSGSDTSEPTNDSADLLQDRMLTVFQAARQSAWRDPQDTSGLDRKIEVITQRAPLYLRQPLPPWPLRFLIRKVLRRLVAPILMPQVAFNEATRDAFLDARRLLEQSCASQAELERRNDELEARVDRMEDQLSALIRSSEGVREASPVAAEAV